MTVHVERFFMMPWADLLEEKGKLRHATELEEKGGRKCRRNYECKSADATEVCPLDLYENDHGLLIRADLPGFTKEQIAISLDGEGRLQIKATRTKPQGEEGEWRSVLRERSMSEEVGRTVMLPRDAQPDQAQASYQEGVLEVRIPKEQPQKKQILIN